MSALFAGPLPAWAVGEDIDNAYAEVRDGRLWAAVHRWGRFTDDALALPANPVLTAAMQPCTEAPAGLDEALAPIRLLAPCRPVGTRARHGHLYLQLTADDVVVGDQLRLGEDGLHGLYVRLRDVHTFPDGRGHLGGPAWLHVGTVRRRGAVLWACTPALGELTVWDALGTVNRRRPEGLVDLGPLPGVEDWVAAHRVLVDRHGLVQIGPCVLTEHAARALVALAGEQGSTSLQPRTTCAAKAPPKVAGHWPFTR